MSDRPDQPYDRLWGGVEPASSRRLLSAALEAFSQHGFEGATTRDVAERAGMSPAAVYTHYRSKVELLQAIAKHGHIDVLGQVRAALSESDVPRERLRRFVEAFAAWHARNHTLARVIQYEIAALPADRMVEIRELRRSFEQIVTGELRAGVEAGTFEVEDAPATARAILSLGIDVARWYGTTRVAAPAELGALYGRLVLRMVNAD